MDMKNQSSKQNIHTLGLSYIYSYLNGEGYTIYEVNTDPHHHFQILAKRDDDLIIVIVRTAYDSETLTIDKNLQQRLVEESERLDATPHVARLSVSPLHTNNLEIDGVSEGTEYRVIFNGLTTL